MFINNALYFVMKNKTIIVGACGSGTSHLALQMALKNTGTTMIVNGILRKEKYETEFPVLESFEEKNGSTSFRVNKNGKYYLSELVRVKHQNLTQFAKSVILGCDYGDLKEEKEALVVYDDGIWSVEEDKLQTLWQLSHTKCGIIIVTQNLSDFFGIKNNQLTNDMLSDVKKHWNLIYCKKPGETGKIKKLEDVSKSCF